MDRFGIIFGEELVAAGLGGLPLAINSTTGTITGIENLTPAQKLTLQAVITHHDPTAGRRLTPFQRLAMAGLTVEDLLFLITRHYGFSHGTSAAGAVSG
jgi:hypothetical protein